MKTAYNLWFGEPVRRYTNRYNGKPLEVADEYRFALCDKRKNWVITVGHNWDELIEAIGHEEALIRCDIANLEEALLAYHSGRKVYTEKDLYGNEWENQVDLSPEYGELLMADLKYSEDKLASVSEWNIVELKRI